MSPKLYEELNAKFLSIWGEYAGWAHTVHRLDFDLRRIRLIAFLGAVHG